MGRFCSYLLSNRRVEHPKSKSTQPGFASRWVTLYGCGGPTGFYQRLNESHHDLQVDSARAESAGLRAEVEGLRRSADDSRDTIQLNINRFFNYRVWFYTSARTHVDIQLSCTPGRPRPTAGTSRTCAERSSCFQRRSPTLSAATGKSKMASQSVFHSFRKFHYF